MTPDEAKALQAAEAFDDAFEPRDGVDYGWVVKHARERYEDLRATFYKLDEKAATVFTVMSSITGALAIGSLTGVATAKVPLVVIWMAVPSLFAALLAVVFAVLARRPMPIYHPSNVTDAVEIAEYYKTAEWGEAAYLTRWHVVTFQFAPIVTAKSRLLGWAHWLMIAALGLLALPLLMFLVVGPSVPEEPKPIRVIVEPPSVIPHSTP